MNIEYYRPYAESNFTPLSETEHMDRLQEWCRIHTTADKGACPVIKYKAIIEKLTHSDLWAQLGSPTSERERLSVRMSLIEFEDLKHDFLSATTKADFEQNEQKIDDENISIDATMVVAKLLDAAHDLIQTFDPSQESSVVTNAFNKLNDLLQYLQIFITEKCDAYLYDPSAPISKADPLSLRRTIRAA